VVGIGAAPSSASALGFGFRAAAQRGIPLAAVHAWQGDTAVGCEFSSRTAEADARRTLGRALGRWREEFVDVPVLTRLPHADPSAALIRESVGAAMVVVSSHRRGAVIAGLRDSVSRSVVLGAHSAVAVVHTDGAGVNSTAVGRRRRRSAVPTGNVDSAVT
jgi:nucleotide-binding universal stress UspA family protein